MRIFSTLLFVCCSVLLHAQSNQLTKGLTGKTDGLNMPANPADTSKPTIFIRCGYSKSLDPGPLLVVDGFPQKLSMLGSINPNDITSVEILKPAAAQAIYGREAMEGVIIVTTNKRQQDVLVIKDSIDGSAIGGATVTFISAGKKDTLMYVADEKGRVLTEELVKDKEYEITISSVGYKSGSSVFKRNGKEQEILLTRDFKNASDVVVVAYTIISCRRYYMCCGVSCKREVLQAKKSDSVTISSPGLKLFPNPVARGANFSVALDQQGVAAIRVVGLNGNIILTQNVAKDAAVQTVRTDPRWAAGIYFVQLVYENGRVAASERIIIQ